MDYLAIGLCVLGLMCLAVPHLVEDSPAEYKKFRIAGVFMFIVGVLIWLGLRWY